MINEWKSEGENLKMITQTNFQGPESDPSDIKKEMSPQTNIHAPSFEDDEFDIPPVIFQFLIFFNLSFTNSMISILPLFDDYIPARKTKV